MLFCVSLGDVGNLETEANIIQKDWQIQNLASKGS